MDIFAIDPAAIDANVIYLSLVISLWIGVTAAHMPGTGILEGIAALGVIGSLVVLLQMDVRLIAVLVLVLGVGAFSVVPFIHQKYAPWALGGLGLQAIGAFLLFTDRSVDPFVILLTVVVPFVYYQFILHPMLTNVRGQPVADKDDLLIGATGRVTADIDPTGTVHVNSETWTATSEQRLREGTTVVVIGREGLRLIVEGVKAKRREEFAPEES